MISIAPITYDINAPVEIEPLPQSVIQAISRRMTRTPTLDLGVSLVDNGFTHADRTLSVMANITEAQHDILYVFVQTYSLFYIGLPEGLFRGAIEEYKNDNGEVTLSILIQEKLSEG